MVALGCVVVKSPVNRVGRQRHGWFAEKESFGWHSHGSQVTKGDGAGMMNAPASAYAGCCCRPSLAKVVVSVPFARLPSDVTQRLAENAGHGGW